MSEKIQSPNNLVRILIAEDSPTQAERLKYTLERHGYQVTAAANGRLALQAARLLKPALIITDIIMPEMDGYQLCQQIKSDPQLQKTPVILVTTLSDPQDVIRGLECRADNFIIKPYDENYLLSRIQSLLFNDQVREPADPSAGVEIYFNGQRHLITADRPQILNLLLSTYEAAIHRNKELMQTREDLRSANSALEASNKELEAFSYSVSHDLRAPLRAIEGFTRSLLIDYGGQLDEQAKDLLHRAQNGCDRMGQLIEDLLNLSRLSRSEMHCQDVDLSSLVNAIAADLQSNHPGRKVTTRIAEGLIANGDGKLLRIALENLLGNAWKFTSRREDAQIEFNAEPEGGGGFFIRDNGAGFDMAYAEKLFGAFQRLHSTAEFPGTGIGLAIVQRIINRHGGRIWAEGKVGVGATFHFSL